MKYEYEYEDASLEDYAGSSGSSSRLGLNMNVPSGLGYGDEEEDVYSLQRHVDIIDQVDRQRIYSYSQTSLFARDQPNGTTTTIDDMSLLEGSGSSIVNAAAAAFVYGGAYAGPPNPLHQQQPRPQPPHQHYPQRHLHYPIPESEQSYQQSTNDVSYMNGSIEEMAQEPDSEDAHPATRTSKNANKTTATTTTTGKRKASSVPSQEEETHSGTGKKKRNRAVLSCRPCKARKIKCDRLQPCSSCIRRNMVDECQWDDPSKIIDVQPFATAVEVEDLRARLEQVESLLSRVSSGTLKSLEGKSTHHHHHPTNKAPTNNEYHHETKSSTTTTTTTTTNASLAGDSDVEPDNEGEEAAVGALEELALGHRPLDPKDSNSPANATQSDNLLVSRNCFSMLRPAGPEEDILCNYKMAKAQPQDIRTESTIFLRQSPRLEEEYATEFLRATSASHQMANVFKALPRRSVTLALVKFFELDLMWMSKAIYFPYFNRELEDFWNYVEQGKDLEMIDPAWMALLFIILAIAARAMPLDLLPGEDPAVMNALPNQFYKACDMCMSMANWSNRPQFRVIQTLSLEGVFIWFVASRNQGLVLLSGAVRIAQLLGLHLLTDKEDSMPQWDDLSFASGPSSVKRQMCLRLWSQLMMLDCSYTSSIDQLAFFPVPGATSPLPAHCNDEDLGLHLHINEKPSYVLTDMTFDMVRWRVAQMWRLAESKGKQTYDDILTQDAALRQLIGQVPPDLMSVDSGVTPSTRLMVWKKNMFISGVYSRIVRLHKPFFYKSFKNVKYAASHAACISASAAVINANATMTVASKQERFWILYVQLFGASICILIDLLHSVDADCPEGSRITDERIEQALKAAETFRHARRTSRIKDSVRIGTIGEALVKTTIAAAKERQALSPSERAGVTYADTFKRITATVQEKAQHQQAPTPLPSTATLPPLYDPKNTAAPDFFMSDPSTATLLRSLGLSIDGLVVPSPQESNSSSTGGILPGQLSDSVFDGMFNNNVLLDDSWLGLEGPIFM